MTRNGDEMDYRGYVQQALDLAVENGEVAGANVLIIKDGEEVCYSQSGYANREQNKKFERDTITRAYSMTKPLTAAAAMILQERGILDPLEPVSKYLEGFKNQEVYRGNVRVPVKREVTIHDLLFMTSGLSYGGADGDNCARETQLLFQELHERLYSEDAMSTLELCNRLGKCGLAFQPGESWRYGTSADVLGAVIEVVTGMRFGTFLKRELFDSLGMKDTGFFVPEEKQERLARSYRRTPGGLEEYETDHLGNTYLRERDPAFESGGAGIVTTLDDYAKFAQMLMNGGSYHGKRILTESTVHYFTTGRLLPQQQKELWKCWETLAGYSYGNLMRVLVEPGMAYYHGTEGEYGWDGWLGTYFCNSPRDGLTMLFSCQLDGGGILEVTRRIKNIIFAHLAD